MNERGCHNLIYTGLCDLELPANLHILFTSCSSQVSNFYTEFYSETTFHFGFEESEARKVVLGENQEKTG